MCDTCPKRDRQDSHELHLVQDQNGYWHGRTSNGAVETGKYGAHDPQDIIRMAEYRLVPDANVFVYRLQVQTKLGALKQMQAGRVSRLPAETVPQLTQDEFGSWSKR